MGSSGINAVHGDPSPHKKRSSHILFFSPTGSVEMAAESSTKKFGKGERTVPHHSEKASKYYPAIDEAVPRKTRKAVRPAKLRQSLKPGTVLILLGGHHECSALPI